MDENTRSLLYDLPVGADYAADVSELEPEDIPPGRVQKVRELMVGEDPFLRFEAARTLCAWGDDQGFAYIRRLLCDPPSSLETWHLHRLGNYDDTPRLALLALQSYWSHRATSSKEEGEQARRAIYGPVAHIIAMSSQAPFALDPFFFMVEKLGFVEYVPDLKRHLEAIIKDPAVHGWKISDCARLLLKFDPEFVHELLAQEGKTINDLRGP